MDFVHFWSIFSRWWWLVTATVLIAAIGSLVVSKHTTPVYQSSTRLLVSEGQSSGTTTYDDFLTSQNLAATYIEFLHGTPLLQEVVSSLHLPYSTTHLDQNTNGQVIRNTPIVEITVQDTDRARTPRIADQLGQALIKTVQDLQANRTRAAISQTQQQLNALSRSMADLSSQLDRLRRVVPADANTLATIDTVQNSLTQDQASYAQLLTTQEQMAIAQAQAASTITVVAPAALPSSPVVPNTRRNLILAVVAGFLFGFAIAVLVDLVDTHVRGSESVGRRLAPYTA